MKKRFPIRTFALVAGCLGAFAAFAGEPCLEGGKWDAKCLRQQYQAPLKAWPAPRIEGGGDWREMAAVTPPDLPGSVPHAQLRLGIRLFYDPALSASGELACASCHRPEQAFADTLPVTPGHAGRKGKRNAPALVTASHSTSLFWDGRSPTLEHQALGPIADPAEMAMALERLPAKLQAIAGYPEDFARAYGDPAITLERLQSALAAYQRTLVPAATRFDDFLRGKGDAYSDQEVLGLHLFRTKAGCMTCHHGPALSDNGFHNLGLTYFGRKYEDLGRYNVTGDARDVGKFKTPTLRNVARSAPWMHNGLFPSLRGVVNMYNAGMFRPKPQNAAQAADPLFPVTSGLLKPLDMNQEEIRAVEAFLRTL